MQHPGTHHRTRPGRRPHHVRRSAAAVAAVAVLGSLFSLVPGAPTAGAARSEGLKLVGIVRDENDAHFNGNVYGAFTIDSEQRLLFQFYEDAAGVHFTATSLDEIRDGVFQEAFDILVDSDVPPGAVDALAFDKSRLDVDVAEMEPVWALDSTRGRLMYAAEGSIYEVDYDARTGSHTLAKWVAPPHPGGETPAFLPSGAGNPTGDGSFQPSFGIGFHEDPDEPMLYQVGQFKDSPGETGSTRPVVWIQGWDARPGDPDAAAQPRQAWFAVSTTCRNLARSPETRNQAPVFRHENWLYTFCDGSSDGSAKGVVRFELNPFTGEPTGTEQFFPGVTGTAINVFANPEMARIYMLSFNERAQERSVLVFDGTANEGAGAYIGAIPVGGPRFNAATGTNNLAPGSGMGGFDPETARWYFQSTDGMKLQEGALQRVFAPDTRDRDLDGGDLRFPVRRPLRVDPARDGHGPRVFVEREVDFCGRYGLDNCIAVYEDTVASAGGSTAPLENTLNVPETDDLVGTYSGLASAFGVRTRVLRGLSSAWPGSAGFLSLEGEPPDDPSPERFPGSLGWWATDPFFYHGGDCGAKDRELTIGRIFQTSVAGGLGDYREAGAGALAVDPEFHVNSTVSDTQTRDDLADPDPCTRRFYERLTGPNCYRGPDQDDGEDTAQPLEGGCQFDSQAYGPSVGEFCRNAEAEDPDNYQRFVDTFGDQCSKPFNTEAAGREWPYERVDCDDRGSDETHSMPPVGPAFTAVSVSCAANADEPESSARTHVAMTPDPMASLVTVGEVETSTELVRRPARDGEVGKGLEVASTAVLRNISIAASVHIAEFEVTATARAEGYATDEGSTAETEYDRAFRGVSVDGAPLCGVSVPQPSGDGSDPEPPAPECDPQQVAEAISGVIGAYGYVRAPDPEPDYTEGTRKGTLAKVQKNLVLQDADAVMNKDVSTEWVGLEIGVYRDSQIRGTGRWIFQLGGVFAQSKFGVIPDFSALPDLGFVPDAGLLDLDVAPERPAVAGAFDPGRPGRTVAIPVGGEANAVSAAPPPPGLVEQIVEGVRRSIEMAMVLAALWTLVYGPVYLTKRRSLLREVMMR